MKRAFHAAAATAAALAILALAGCREGGGTVAVIEVGGSSSVAAALELLAAEYQELNPGVRLNINATGSSDGILNAGTLYQFGMSSRELTPVELGMGLSQRLVAIDGIAVIVHPGSPVRSLTVEQIRAIYTGEATDWGDVTAGIKTGAIAVVSREAGSGTRGAFEEIAGFPGRLRPGAVEAHSTGAVRSTVAGNPSAIGYISVGSVDPSVRAISVGGVAPTEENMRSGAYRIARPFILVYNELRPESRAFLDWAVTAGQDVVARNWVRAN